MVNVRGQCQSQGLALELRVSISARVDVWVSIRVRGQRMVEGQCYGQGLRLGLWISVWVRVYGQELGLGLSFRVYYLFLLCFCQASHWRHNSSSQAVAVGILAAKQTHCLTYSFVLTCSSYCCSNFANCLCYWSILLFMTSHCVYFCQSFVDSVAF